MNRFKDIYPRRAVLVLVTAATMGAAAACGGSTSGTSARSVLTIGADTDAAATGYDPLLYSQTQYTVFSTMYDALFVTQPDGTTAPNLVKSFSRSADGKKLTLTLRDGVTFTDGSTLTAALVKKNLDRRDDKTLNAYGQLAKGGASEITDVASPDSKTVVITWKSAQTSGQDALADQAGIIVGAKGIANPASLKTTPDGSGPYALDAAKTTRGSVYTFTKNAKAWHQKAFPYQKVVVKVISDAQARANAVISGQVDLAAQLGATTVAEVRSRKSVVSVGGTIVGFPVADKLGKSNPAFKDVRVRQALSYAIDRATIVKKLHPASRATAQLFPKGTLGFDPALDTTYAYDVAKARKLLAAAGHPDGFTIKLSVLGQPSSDLVVVQKQWQKIGVKLTFKNVASTDALFAAAATEPLMFGPFAVGAKPQGFVAGVVVGGFMNLQKAKDPDISANLGASLASTGTEQTKALKALNNAVTNKGWYLPIYEDYIYWGYDSSKVAKPSYAGSNGYLVLSSIKPAQ